MSGGENVSEVIKKKLLLSRWIYLFPSHLINPQVAAYSVKQIGVSLRINADVRKACKHTKKRGTQPPLHATVTQLVAFADVFLEIFLTPVSHALDRGRARSLDLIAIDTS